MWQSPDPILDQYMDGKPNGGVFNPKNLSLFTYTYNNPVNMTVPDGEFVFLAAAVPWVLKGVALAGAAMTGYEVGTAINEVASGQKTVGEAATDAAGDVAIGVAMTATGTTALKLVPKSVKNKVAETVNDALEKVDYSIIKDPVNVYVGKNFTARQKIEALELNKKANNGVVKSDQSGTSLVKPKKSQRGVTPSPNEWQFDHVISKKKGGTNSSSNLQILSRKENRDTSDN